MQFLINLMKFFCFKFKVDEIIYIENLKEMRQRLFEIKNSIFAIKNEVEIEKTNNKKAIELFIFEIDKVLLLILIVKNFF